MDVHFIILKNMAQELKTNESKKRMKK